MSDKERILLFLVNHIYCNSLYSPSKLEKWRNIQPGLITKMNPLEPGDLVTTMTAFRPNAFMVGFVEEIKPDCVVIREIGSNRLCNYYNEFFYRIDKELLGYEILEGVQYETYQKVLKAFSNSENCYTIRFQGIKFDGNICTVKSRGVFSDELVYTVSFKYNKKTSIESIMESLNKAANEAAEKLSKGAGAEKGEGN